MGKSQKLDNVKVNKFKPNTNKIIIFLVNNLFSITKTLFEDIRALCENANLRPCQSPSLVSPMHPGFPTLQNFKDKIVDLPTLVFL